MSVSEFVSDTGTRAHQSPRRSTGPRDWSDTSKACGSPSDHWRTNAVMSSPSIIEVTTISQSGEGGPFPGDAARFKQEHSKLGPLRAPFARQRRKPSRASSIRVWSLGAPVRRSQHRTERFGSQAQRWPSPNEHNAHEKHSCANAPDRAVPASSIFAMPDAEDGLA